MKLTEIVQINEEITKVEQLNVLLNKSPKKEWVKEHPFVKGVKYIPIALVEDLLTQIFQQWRVEVIDYKQLANAITCQVRLHYLHPISKEWSFHDGVGAVDIQTKQGASPADLSQITANAVMKGLPAAKAFAIKDAAEHLGRLFGRDINRKDSNPKYNSAIHPDHIYPDTDTQ